MGVKAVKAALAQDVKPGAAHQCALHPLKKGEARPKAEGALSRTFGALSRTFGALCVLRRLRARALLAH